MVFFDSIMPNFQQLIELLSLFAFAFGAATLLPLSSEVAVATAIKAGSAPVPMVVAAASFGNVAGSCVNWWLGREARRFEGRRWFPLSRADLETASAKFARYGQATLLLAWLPIVGDPLTFVAGALRVPFLRFLILVALGKVVRYAILASAVTGF